MTLNMVQDQRENMRKRAEPAQRVAHEKKEAKRRKRELEQRIAQQKRETKRKRVELERIAKDSHPFGRGPILSIDVTSCHQDDNTR